MNRHKQIAKLMLPLIDLTSLNETDTEEQIVSLCAKAHSEKGHVAAVCIYPRFIKKALSCLRLTGIPVATVVNFPEGNQSLSQTVLAIEDAIRQGVAEIDLVMPYRRYQAGEIDYCREFIRTCKSACTDEIILKVILETGELLDPAVIEAAASAAIQSGADFIKTSTGKTTIGATVSATEAMCRAIKRHNEETGHKIGFKASGGIRYLAQTLPFLATIETLLGDTWLHPDTCRFGASSLLDDVFAQL